MTSVQLKKWGNSQGVRIPKEVLDVLEIPSNATFILHVDKELNTISLELDNGLTPYQKLVRDNAKNEAVSFRWDSVGVELL